MAKVCLPDSDCHDEIRILVYRNEVLEDTFSLDSRHKEIEIADEIVNHDDVSIAAVFLKSNGEPDGPESTLKARVSHATPEPIIEDQARPDQPAVSGEPAQPVAGDAAEPAAEGNRNGEADSDPQAVSEAGVKQEIESEAGHDGSQSEATESASIQVADHIGLSDHLLEAEPVAKAATNYKPLPRKKNKW